MPDYSCLGQTNGCGPSCPSSHSFVFIRGTVNIDDQNPFRIKMPNVYNHSLALTELLVGNSMSRMAQTEAAHQKLEATVFTKYPNLKYPFIWLALVGGKVMLQM